GEAPGERVARAGGRHRRAGPGPGDGDVLPGDRLRRHVAAVAVRRRRRAGVVGAVDGARPGFVTARRSEGARDRSRARDDGRRSRTMKVALRELRRRPARFVTATVILTLVAVLVMFLGGL